MSELSERLAGHEPSLHTVEMVCDRLAELGLAVGPDTARQLVRAVLTAEAPRVDARLREALDTALETIRVAAQSAMGVLAHTAASEVRTREPAPPEQLHVSRAAPPSPAPAPRRPPAPPESRPPQQRPPERGQAEPRQPERKPIDPRQAERKPIDPRQAEPRQAEPRQAESRPPEPRRPRNDFDEEERRPVFRRPGRR